MKLLSVETCDDRSAAQRSCCSPIAVTKACRATSLTTIPEMPTSANFDGLRRDRKRRRTRGRRCQRVASGRSVRARHGSLGADGRRRHRNRAPRWSVKTRGHTETPEGTNRSARSVAVDASTYDSVPPYPGPNSTPLMQAPASSLPVRHGPFGQNQRYGRPGRLWLWGYPRTSRSGSADRRSLSTVRPRSPRPSLSGRRPRGQRSSGQRDPPGRRAIPARSSSGPGGGHGNARRNRRSSAESPRASSSGLKASVHRPLRARPTMTAARHGGYRLIHDLRGCEPRIPGGRPRDGGVAGR